MIYKKRLILLLIILIISFPKLQLDEEDPRVADSDWEVTKKEGEKFFLYAADFLNDEMSIKYLENQLDTDQELGEWNKLK